MNDLPSWGHVIARTVVFLALVAGSQIVVVYLLTGEWFGNPDDHPLWVGPVSGALAVVNAVGTVVAGLMLSESQKEIERG
ncbi:hypothetical protein [Nonomuraea sp. SYSU D8015]|uniref:hypothetical protein n=1 Tax=Nonomuraea sp. SYSU D8015 TaxID=2593644 RepID=UPI001660F656|nr:hypothetical protein [Nonomuraea sp. SYSU D8015]